MYRAYWAIPRTLKTSSGEQTNAVFGVATMLHTILRTEQPDALLFTFDAGGETFRHQEHTEYKEGRAETPDDFYVQIPRILEFIQAMRIPSVSDPKFEADDFLCSYAKAGEKAGMKVTIVTGDRDALQLATENVRVAIPHKGYLAPEYLGPTEIENKYGIRPDQVPAYKGLCGDASDNLAGVKGIGPKGAAALIQKYGTLENIYAHLEEISASTRAKLEKDRDSAFFCERMAELVCVDPLPIPLEDLRVTPIPMTDMVTLLQSLEFQSLINRYRTLANQPYGKKFFLPEEGMVLVAAAKKEEPPQLSLF